MVAGVMMEVGVCVIAPGGGVEVVGVAGAGVSDKTVAAPTLTAALIDLRSCGRWMRFLYPGARRSATGAEKRLANL